MSNLEKQYESEQELQKQVLKVQKLMEKNPNRIPIVIVFEKETETMFGVAKKKLLIPGNYKINDLLKTIKKDCTITSDKALYFFTKNVMVKQNDTIKALYDKYKSDDILLYIRCTGMPTFGCSL